MPAFAQAIIAWQLRFGRHDLPWQNTQDPYRIWISEVMLQQTQVSAVIDYFQKFIAAFPNLQALSDAPLEHVLRRWSGLGYYSRARNLHACARRLIGEHGGQFPRSAAQLADLPGIGRSTAAAIAVFAYGQRAAILDGNVKRVFSRVFGIDGYPGERKVELELWRIAERELPEQGIERYTQGLMDFGATLCTRRKPACERCPLGGAALHEAGGGVRRGHGCVAFQTGRVDELPRARPKRSLPERDVTMIVMRRGADLLVQRRPARGVWAGLWSLPELDGGATLEQVRRFADSLDARVIGVDPLPRIRHAFTHFKLTIDPWLVRLDGPVRLADAAATSAELGGTMWLSDAEVADAALPKPIKTLLLGVLGHAHASS